MTFIWKGETHRLRSGITKLFCAGTYLLAYYTWTNSSVMYNLKRPQMVSHKMSDEWHQMPAFKRRAFKTITVEIGAHDRLEIPKYALQFFDRLLNASRLIDPNPDAFLLHKCNSGKVQMMTGATLSGFKRNWLSRHFPMTDERGIRLEPIIRRFRATGGQLLLARKSPIEAALLLDNTPNVVNLSYSSGNPHENNLMNRDTALTLEHQVRDRQGVEKAKEKVRTSQNVEVLAYDAYIDRCTPLIRSATGSFCKNPYGNSAQKYIKRLENHGLLKEGERLACADLLKCFSCAEQVIVESVKDIWCVLSFRDCLEESLYLHRDKAHHEKNFGQVLNNISARLQLINPKVIRQAENKLSFDGRHPLWPDAASVDIF